METAKSKSCSVVRGKKVIFKIIVIVWVIDVDDVICEGCKGPVEEYKRID